MNSSVLPNTSRARRFAAAALLLLAIGANPFTLGYLFADGTALQYRTWQFLIAAADLACAAAGIGMWRRRAPLRAGTAAMACLVCIVTLAATEAGLRLVSKYAYKHTYMTIAERAGLSFFRDKPWTAGLYDEFLGLKLRIDPYTCWTEDEFHGRYLNIGSDGSRATVQHGDGNDTLLMLGGSSLMGLYARDSATIPSLLSAELARRGAPMRVLNYGARGQVFTQNLARLVQLLREGARPKVVAFYGGINEALAAYYYDSTGVIGLAGDVQRLLDISRSSYPAKIWAVTREYVEKDLMLFNAASRVVSAAGLANRGTANRLPPARLQAHARAIGVEFRKTYETVDALSKAYGFRYVFILQPSIFTRRQRAAEENFVDILEDDPAQASLVLNSYREIRDLRLEHVVDFSSVFDSISAPVYMDCCHVSEEGNGVVARELIGLVDLPRPTP